MKSLSIFDFFLFIGVNGSRKEGIQGKTNQYYHEHNQHNWNDEKNICSLHRHPF